MNTRFLENIKNWRARLSKLNQSHKVWLMFLLLIPYLIICLLQDSSYWIWRKTFDAIKWFDTVIKRKT